MTAGVRLSTPSGYIGYCEDHSKRLYESRHAARAHQVASHRHGGHMQAYRCDTHPGLWHLGHLHPTIRRRGRYHSADRILIEVIRDVAVVITLAWQTDPAIIVSALLSYADAADEHGDTGEATACRELADAIGDALDAHPHVQAVR